MLRKNFEKIKRLLNKKLKNVHYKLYPHLYAPNFWIGLATNNKAGRIVQIGSNDGKADDPLHQLINKNLQWEVHFVEPVDDAFKRLKNNYGDENRYHFHQIAINDGSTQIFYSVSPDAEKALPSLPQHFNKLGSFFKNNILKHLGPTIEPFIEQKEIQGLSLHQFLSQNKIEKMLVLHVDTEGYDWEILKQLDLNKCAPTVVLFEHKHLTIQDKNLALAHFKSKYDMYRFGQDVLCLRQNLLVTFTNKQQKILENKRLKTF